MKKPTIEYYDNGQKEFEIYHNDNGKLHCEDGPAITLWYENGQMQTKEYWINGKLHREDGPAAIYWYENGQIIEEQYWINGKRLDKFDIRKLKLEKLNLL